MERGIPQRVRNSDNFKGRLIEEIAVRFERAARLGPHPEWLSMLRHALREGSRCDISVENARGAVRR